MSTLHFNQASRDPLVDGDLGHAIVIHKKARAVAVRIGEPFDVETSQGTMKGNAGDWLVTNHPDDDPGSDVWVVSRERMDATYVQHDTPDRAEP